MNTALWAIVIVLAFTACKKKSKYEGVSFTEKEPRDWENPEMFNQNREEAHATFISFTDEQSALEAIKTNILGVEYLIAAAMEQKVEKVSVLDRPSMISQRTNLTLTL